MSLYVLCMGSVWVLHLPLYNSKNVCECKSLFVSVCLYGPAMKWQLMQDLEEEADIDIWRMDGWTCSSAEMIKLSSRIEIHALLVAVTANGRLSSCKPNKPWHATNTLPNQMHIPFSTWKALWLCDIQLKWRVITQRLCQKIEIALAVYKWSCCDPITLLFSISEVRMPFSYFTTAVLKECVSRCLGGLWQEAHRIQCHKLLISTLNMCWIA